MIKIYIGDREHWSEPLDEFNEMKYWAYAHCKSFVEMILTDVSDVSLYHEMVAEFRFNDQRDATMFTLRWAQ